MKVSEFLRFVFFSLNILDFRMCRLILGLPRELAPEPTLRQAEHQTKVLYAESIEYIFGMDLFGIFLSVSLNASQMSNNGEAHHCSGKHPANQIMQNFYHPLLHTASPNVPSILGLSASPIVRTSAKGLE